ncbi:MAG: hypothetical protein IPL84_03710 [Chitinophagaceae bacterium]|nr:hypothetical protein [Chitinophagaceae bacterium]
MVSASAIGWYGADKDPVKSFNETDESSPDFLGTTCKLWEKSMEPVTWLGKRLVTLRIGIVLSNDGGATARIQETASFWIGNYFRHRQTKSSAGYILTTCATCLLPPLKMKKCRAFIVR